MPVMPTLEQVRHLTLLFYQQRGLGRDPPACGRSSWIADAVAPQARERRGARWGWYPAPLQRPAHQRNGGYEHRMKAA